MKPILFCIPSSQDSVVTEEDHMPFFYNYFHRHKEIQVTLILKGEGNVVIGNVNQPFHPGDIYIIGSNQPHIFKSSPTHFEDLQKDRIHAFHIYLDAEKIKNLKQLPEMDSINRFLDSTTTGFRVPKGSSEIATRIIGSIKNSMGLKKLLYFIELMQFFSVASGEWKSLCGTSTDHCVPDLGARMNEVYHYTLLHYHENITLEKIAQVSHMTPPAFCKYFKKHTSKTYITFLQEIRVREACKKIQRQELDSLSSIAYACGFNSPINFHKVFKKYIGISPSSYLREHKLNEDLSTRLLAS
jgi:AraC-like DNA-binding protein